MSAGPVIEARDVSLALDGRPVLEGVSCTLQAGCWTAIVGPNGAGKSTLLSLLAGLRRPDRGSVQVGGDPIDALAPRERARRIAWLAQQDEAETELAVHDIVALGRLPWLGLLGTPGAADARAVARAMQATGTTGFATRRLGELSGGERQRVLLARALAVEAPAVLLDEPTAHLDPPHRRTVADCIARLAREGATVAVVLHDLTLALAADRVLVLAGGRLRGGGVPGDPALHALLAEVFEHSISIERVQAGGRPRWVAVPAAVSGDGTAE